MTRFLWPILLGLLAAAPSARAQQRGGDTRDQVCASQTTIDTWQLPAGDTHGVHEFARSAKIELPAGLAALDVELWSAGGGGGRGSVETVSEGGYGGGGGASGAYTRTTVSVAARELVIAVGLGGDGGQQTSADGQRGGTTAICDGGRALAVVAGGSGGRGGHANKRGGEGGGVEAVTAGADAVSRASNGGAPGTAPLFDRRGGGGAGGAAITGNIQPPAAFGGQGGAGATTALAPVNGSRGGDGYAVVRW